MADDLKKRGPADAARINVNEPWELAYWTTTLRVTPEALKAAVKKVGVMVVDVRRELGR